MAGRLEGTYLVYAMPEKVDSSEALMYALDAWNDRFGGKPASVLVSPTFLAGAPTHVREVRVTASAAVHGLYAWMPV